MAIPGFLKESGDKLLFNPQHKDDELIFYIPEQYFDNGKLGLTIGEYIEVMGVFDYDVFYDGGKKHLGLKNFCFPSMIRTKPYTMEKVADFHIKKDIVLPYRLLRYKKDDEVISNINVVKGTSNVEGFMDLLLHGHLPPTIPYDKVQEYISYNAALNGFSYKISAQIYGIVVSELFRDSNDLSKPFRLSNCKDMTDYKLMNIKSVPKYVSPFVAITSENADESIANAIVNKSGTESPLEKVVMN